MIIFISLFGTVSGGLALVGYACLWNEYIWSHLGFETSCATMGFGDTLTFWVLGFMLGLLDTLLTIPLCMAAGTILGGIVYSIFSLIIACSERYSEAKLDSELKRPVEETRLLQIKTQEDL